MFGFFKARKASARKERIESLANSCQFELYKTAIAAIQQKSDKEVAGKIAAGIANFIMQFGHRNTEHKEDSELLELIDIELKECHTYFGYKFQQNMLGCLILLAALWRVPLNEFESHVQRLHSLGLFKLGPNTPDVSGDLQPDELAYMYELTAMKD